MHRPKRKAASREHTAAPAPKTAKTLEETLREVEAIKKQLAEEARREVEALEKHLVDTQKLAEKNFEAHLQEVADDAIRYLRVVPRILTMMNVSNDNRDRLTNTVASVSASGGAAQAQAFTKHLFRRGRGLCNQRMDMARWDFLDGAALALKCDSHAEVSLGYRPPNKRFIWSRVPSLTSFPGLPCDVTAAMVKNTDNATAFLRRFGVNVINMMLASVCIKEPFLDFVEFHTKQYRYDTKQYCATQITTEIMFDYHQLRYCAQATSGNIFWGHSYCHQTNDSLTIPPFLDTIMPFRIKSIFSRRCAPPPRLADH